MKPELYTGRALAAGVPSLESRGADYQADHQTSHPFTKAVIDCVDRLVALAGDRRRALVVGCGPQPMAVKDLLDSGFDAFAIEPVEDSVGRAQAFLSAPHRVRQGTCERLPFPDATFGFVLMESVLEHVDSPSLALTEVCRVLQPGGVIYIYTTNRWKFSPRGFTGEYSVRFINWFPRIVQESYVFQMLHYEPQLANYNARPAVHWFSFPDLCRLGRAAGFAQFYSPLDLIDESSPFVSDSRIRRFVLNRVRYRPWLRALALTQSGGAIFMYKRPT
jgi:SAM-dependent methyltransferase